MRTPGRLTGWAILAVLVFAYESPGSAQPMGNKMSADQLRTELAGKLVTDKASTDGSFTIAQTNGTNRRQDRRGDRQDCRQQEGVGADKRNCKQEGRQTR